VGREAQDRIRAAIVNSGEQWPVQITVSLPTERGSRADLAIAVSVLAAAGAVPAVALAGVMFCAELGLDGRLRPVPSVQAAVVAAAAHRGFRTVMVAAENAAEAALVPGVRVIAAQTFTEVTAWLRSGSADMLVVHDERDLFPR
jgi:magnesium chelatase family protein